MERNMKKYVIASRRSGRFSEQSKVNAVASFENFSNETISQSTDNFRNVKTLSPRGETRRRASIFETSEANARELARDLPEDLILEPLLHYYPSDPQPLGLNQLSDINVSQNDSIFGVDQELNIEVRGGGKPLEDARVSVTFRSGNLRDRVEGTTDGNGRVRMRYSRLFEPSVLLVAPYHSFWTVLKFGITNNVRVNCPGLPGRTTLGWWHKLMNTRRTYNPWLGQGVKVGVVDSGCGPHGFLDHVTDAGSSIDGVIDNSPQAGGDAGSHGTHVSGTIGARPVPGAGFAGIAPGCDLTSFRVFEAEGGATNVDIANAIDVLSIDHMSDIINMSLGGGGASQIIDDAIQDALERGTVCVVAAGNSGGPVEYPARNHNCLAVSAIGRLGEAPAGTLASARVPNNPSEFGFDNTFIANFSCRGNEINFAGPGVGIIAPVPERFGALQPYAAMDGTSMASPCVAGALAVLLADSADYLALPRNQARSQFAKLLANQSAVSIGLADDLQGRGVPRAS